MVALGGGLSICTHHDGRPMLVIDGVREMLLIETVLADEWGTGDVLVLAMRKVRESGADRFAWLVSSEKLDAVGGVLALQGARLETAGVMLANAVRDASDGAA